MMRPCWILLCTCMRHMPFQNRVLNSTKWLFSWCSLVFSLWQRWTFLLILFGSSKWCNSYAAVVQISTIYNFMKHCTRIKWVESHTVVFNFRCLCSRPWYKYWVGHSERCGQLFSSKPVCNFWMDVLCKQHGCLCGGEDANWSNSFPEMAAL